jgi:uncharacterized membrane protein YcaP (DUF421 family)
LPEIVVIIIRSVVAFTVLLVITRFMGQRQISQMTFFDYVVGITIGSIAGAVSADQNVKLIDGLAATLVWGGFTLLIGMIALKSYRFRKAVQGEPTILIRKGKVLEQNLRKLKMDASELMENLRENQVFHLADVEFAVMETNGQLSVLKKSDLEPVTRRDLGIQTAVRSEPRIVIMDGNVMKRTLQSLGFTEQWLLDKIREQGADRFEDVFLAQLDSAGNLYVDLYRDK